MFAVAVVALVFAGVGKVITSRRPTLDPWSKLSLPTSAQVLHMHTAKSGFDRSDAICVQFRDEAFVDQAIATYAMEPMEDPTSFVSLRAPIWWTVDLLDERYGRMDEETERYFSCWVDRKRRILFLERGRW